ncbi:hypothetical protein BESB_053300 [Besnoitia besnoiti]|uniref:Uncharacterized protein n=1 Tax=Besnoitia besnoiti TaxID=94643 RepID=A0A2A9MCS6_BESBE|nr:hypothetical protein BESB_053300 [Besnoitia besnoiti]PFH35679.1 hypothetical protein BESB_053300 [Besnoitia besnoiti]
MPHGLTVLTATMTGGVVGGPAAAGTAGGCCGWCPCCPCCPTPVAVPAAHAGITVGGGAVPGAAMVPGAAVAPGAAMAPGAAVAPGAAMVPGAVPGGWGAGTAAGGYGASMAPGAAGAAGAGGYYGAATGTPALASMMAWFSGANDHAGKLLKKFRDGTGWPEEGEVSRGDDSGDTTSASEPGDANSRRSSMGSTVRRVKRSPNDSLSESGQSTGSLDFI